MLAREDFSTAKCIAFSKLIASAIQAIGLTSQEYIYTLERNIAAYAVDHNFELLPIFDRIMLHAKEYAEKKKGRIWTP